jgi:pimeloyl-ACP methyl ester carboxylesterase
LAILGLLAALAALGAVYQAVGTRRSRRHLAPPGLLIDAGGHRLHAVCRGSGSPLVLLESGIAASSLSWALVQPQVATFTRVCAYDRAGLAWSDAASSPRTFTRIVDELDAVLAHVSSGERGPERYVLVGHSFGSFVVRTYAARHPADVAGIVLIDPPTEWLTPTPQRARMLRGAIYLSRIGGLFAHLGIVRACAALLTGGAPAAPRWFVKIFGPTTARTLERLVGEIRKLPPDIHPVVQALWCQPKCFQAMADHLSALDRDGASMGALIPPRDVPIIVISSGDQPPEQIAAHQLLAGGSLRGRHIKAARSGHWVLFDEPELVTAIIRELVEAERSGL